MNYSLLRGSCTVVQERQRKDGANRAQRAGSMPRCRPYSQPIGARTVQTERRELALCRGAARTRSLSAAKIQTKNRTAKAFRNIFSVYRKFMLSHPVRNLLRPP